jgi:hypothetical protein
MPISDENFREVPWRRIAVLCSRNKKYSKSSITPYHITFENMQEIYFAFSEMMQNNDVDIKPKQRGGDSALTESTKS